jgi:hypothetical protein
MNDQLVTQIHHVIVRQYKSSTESVSFEHLRICHRKGRTALKFFGTHPPPLRCDTSGPSFAALYLLAENYLSPIWIPSVKDIVRGKRAVRIYYLFSQESKCFPRRSRGKPCDSKENKTNYFPREQTLSVLLYSDKQKSTFNNIHTTIVFHNKNSIQ